jgi:Ni2+-binding GTPase involved in maturation of urease and hydrogenase
MSKSRYVMIGGFLGAGKTAAAIKLAQHLQARGKRAGLITNDQSANLVDTARVRAAGFAVQEIAGGCFCCQFDSLVEASRQLAKSAAPDVLIAEPVGSCTDLMATVAYPLRQLYGDDYELAPLSVLVDPNRCARILGLAAGSSFSPKVLYVYEKQLEEADLLVINKVDLLTSTDRRALAAAVAARFPQSRVFEVSCRTGEGLADWFQCVLTDPLGYRSAMNVDYDVYADGEALLGWLNATARIEASAPFDGNQWLLTLAANLRAMVASADMEIAHLKMTLLPDEGPDLAAVSLTATAAEPQRTHTLQGPLAAGLLTVNLRAEADPELLERLVRQSLADSSPATALLNQLSAFRPGRPNPTHRIPTPGGPTAAGYWSFP